jgi:hypothetical protein
MSDYPGTPRWVQALGLGAIILVLLVAIILMTGIGGPHGPGRHIQSDKVEAGAQGAKDR